MNKHIKGFTLIELLVVTALVLVIIGSIVQLFFGSLKGATQSTLTNETRQNGEYALSVMERMIRNAQSIEDVDTTCDGTAKTSIEIKNPDGYLTEFRCPSGIIDPYIASNSAQITSNKVEVDFANCSFTCNKAPGGTASVTINFTIHQLTPASGVTLRPEEKNSINFKTSVVVRNTGF